MKFAKILQDEVVYERRKASMDYRLGKKYLKNFYADLEDCDTTQDLSPPPQLPATPSLSTLQPSVIGTARSSLIEDNVQSQKVDPHQNSGHTGILGGDTVAELDTSSLPEYPALVYSPDLSTSTRTTPIIRQSQTVKNDDTHYAVTMRAGILLGASLILLIHGIGGALSKYRQAQIPYWADLMAVYGGLFLTILLGCLFGINIHAWSKSRINYKFIFEFDPRDNLGYHEFIELPVIFMFLLCLAFYFDFGWDRTAQASVGYHYPLLVAICIILAILLCPFPIFKWEARRCFLQGMGGIFVSGYNRVEFLDYFLADEMNSLTYSIEQFELAICAYSIRWHDVPQFCTTSQMWATPLVTALPACFRFLQCLRRYHDTFEWCPHLLNAGKYLTSLVQLFVYFIYRSDTSPQTKAAYIVISLITSTYSYTWDVYMDWGLFQFEKHGAGPAGHPLLRAEFIYSQKWVYYFAIVEDFVGRFAWIVRLIPTDLSPLLLSFIIASVEVLRRWIWNFFRVENEYLNNCNQLRATKDILLRNSESETEDEKDNDCRSMSTFKRPSSWFDSDGIGTKW
ncbi:EXS family-domain-containing protein [Gamsiella multidivaricata]|uniref:EXS family-domain-containing protein n=1 Tax=Gamsiella multidivaricata TaxID=101098 RepID=UPI00221E891D|nr:EXS family-domain-containing protein [Gamsiella multidivaricata]KAG0351340.1 hypothetical protein BGZ54_003282 [Gamsiella multidivaricata]KAI7817634.1 EXS family-domain-containing protein [Gamsiella multidivaricata]